MPDVALNKKIGSATKWSTVTEIIAKLISPVTNMILARLLVPETFGIVASITLVITFADLFTDAGFQKYLIQHEFKDEDDLRLSTNVAFISNFVLSIFIWCVIAIFSSSLATLVGCAGYGLGIMVAALDIPLLSFSSIQMALFKRNFDFKTLFKVRMVTSLIPLVVTVPLAAVTRSYWALIIGILAREFVNAFLLTIKSSWKPSLRYSFEKLKEMFGFSVWTMFEQFSIWLTTNVDIFIVGRVLDSHYLGVYKTSITMVNAFMAIITASITPVLFSALSRAQNDESLFRETFFKFQRLVSLFVMPMGLGLFLYRDLATSILLGSQWSEAADLIGLWALISSLVIIFSHFNSEVYRSKGQPKLSLLNQCIHIVFLVITLLIAYPYGFVALYTSRSLIRLTMILIGAFIMWFGFRISFASSFKNVFPTIVCTLIMGAAGYGMLQISTSIVWQIISIVICIAIYFGSIMCFPKTRKEIFGWIKGGVKDVS